MMLTIGQLAARTGATPRALRLYERRGLLTAGRTAAGRRVYGAEHIVLLAQIGTLKDMGLTLAEIAVLMRQRTLDASALIDLRLAQIQAEQARLAELADALHSARAALAEGPMDAGALAHVLAAPTAARFQQLLDRWFSPAEQEAWQAAVPSMDGPVWRSLVRRAKAAVARGVAPDSREGMDIAADWYAALRPLMAAAGRERWNQGAAMLNPANNGGLEHTLRAWLFRAIPAAVEADLIKKEALPPLKSG